MSTGDEFVVLVDETGEPIGSMAKSEVHSDSTPLHLAFSCLVFRKSSEVLLTRRSIAKKTWPGVWTGSCCGHPYPGEKLEDAVRRRVAQELGCSLDNLECILPNFRYRATSAEGLVENEICPVFKADIAGNLEIDSDEVSEHCWVDVGDIREVAFRVPFLLSPWFVQQVEQMVEQMRL